MITSNVVHNMFTPNNLLFLKLLESQEDLVLIALCNPVKNVGVSRFNVVALKSKINLFIKTKSCVD